MANLQNLVPFNSTTSVELAREMGSKGGKVISMKKKIAARVRELKKKGVTNETAKLLVDLMENREFCALDAFTVLLDMKDKPETSQTTYIDTLLKISRHVHGDNKIADNFNFTADLRQQNVHINYESQIKYVKKLDGQLDGLVDAKTKSTILKGMIQDAEVRTE